MDDCIVATNSDAQIVPKRKVYAPKPINHKESHLIYKIRLSHRRGQHTLTRNLFKQLSRVEQQAVSKILGIR